jgi:tetratricopeptide (TPR) repeat protein
LILQEILNMKFWNSLLILLLFIFQLYQLKGQDLFSVSNSSAFADYLFTAGEYDLAANEYERIVFLDSTNLRAKMMLIKSYRMQGDYQKGIARVSSFFKDYSDIPESIATETGRILLHDQQYDEVNDLLHLNDNLSETDKLFLMLSGEMLKGDFKSASLLFENNSGVDAGFITDYGRLIDLERKFNYKKPGISVVMSAILPGSGKVYSGFWKDGLISFIFITASAYQSYRGFNKNGVKSAYGWIFGSLATGFYIGNLYGSGKSANQHNSEFRHKIHHQVEEIFDAYQ